MLNLSEISKYLSEEMNEKEKTDFEKLINNSEKNKKFFNEIKEDWEMIGKFEDKEIYNVDTAWNNLHGRLEKDELLPKHSNLRKINFYKTSKVAAIFIIGLFLSFFAYYTINNLSENKQITAKNTKTETTKQIKLEDGSIVYLNANSKLHYPKKFDKNNRVVEFEGEAFFEIAKMPNKPFIIKSENAEIKVLGTSFNVNTNFKAHKLEVTVKTGKVKLYLPKDKKNGVTLEKGDKGSVVNNKVIKNTNTNNNYLSWKKYFEFNGETLQNVVNTLNIAYNTNIVFENNEISKETMSTTFDNQKLDTILKIICKSQNLKVVKQNKKIVLTRK